MRLKELKELQEKTFMLKCFVDMEEPTEEGRMRAILDVDFIFNCLKVREMRNFNKIGTKKTPYFAMLDIYENLLTQKMQEEYELGIYKKTPVLLDDIVSLSYLFTITYIKTKGTIGKIRKHKDTREIYAPDEESAKLALQGIIKKLKETLVEILSIRKSISSIYTVDGKSYHPYQIEIIKPE